MGMTLLRGRWISDQDNENTPTVIDVDDAFARAYFPHENPIGQHVHIVQFDTEAEIVGVVAHIHQWGPGGDPHAAIEAQFFYPYMQSPAKLMSLLANVTAVVLRTEGDPSAVMGPVRRALAQLNPDYVIPSSGRGLSAMAAGREILRLTKQYVKRIQSFAVETTLSGKSYLHLMRHAREISRGFEASTSAPKVSRSTSCGFPNVFE
jgi:hypothetical protein